MTQDERAKFIENFFQTNCKKLLATKGKEYSRNEVDVNSNFKRCGAAIDINQLKVCWLYMAKHWDAITNYIKYGQVMSDELIESRIADLVNYGFILASLIEEERIYANKTNDVRQTGIEENSRASSTGDFRIK